MAARKTGKGGPGKKFQKGDGRKRGDQSKAAKVKSFVAQHSIPLKKMNKAELLEIFTECFFLSSKQVQEIAADPNTNIIRSIVCSVLYEAKRTADTGRLDALLNRIYGAPNQNINVNHGNNLVEEYLAMTPEQRAETLLELKKESEERRAALALKWAKKQEQQTQPEVIDVTPKPE